MNTHEETLRLIVRVTQSDRSKEYNTPEKLLEQIKSIADEALEPKLLVRWSGNWADETDLDGFFVVSKSEWERNYTILAGMPGEWMTTFGSNMEKRYPSRKAALDEYQFVEISQAELDTLKRLFGKDGMGKASSLYEHLCDCEEIWG